MVKSSTHAEQNREKWRILIKQWEASGLCQTKFCKDKGLDPKKFSYYRKVLSAQQQGKVLPIKIAPDSKSHRPSVEPLTLHFSNEVKLSIPALTEADVLRRIFSAVRGASC